MSSASRKRSRVDEDQRTLMAGYHHEMFYIENYRAENDRFYDVLANIRAPLEADGVHMVPPGVGIEPRTHPVHYVRRAASVLLLRFDRPPRFAMPETVRSFLSGVADGTEQDATVLTAFWLAGTQLVPDMTRELLDAERGPTHHDRDRLGAYLRMCVSSLFRDLLEGRMPTLNTFVSTAVGLYVPFVGVPMKDFRERFVESQRVRRERQKAVTA